MNVNYNNIYSDYIGATGAYSINDYIDITSNNLAINSSNFTLGTSNILDNKINITSNILDSNINNVDIKYNIINPYNSNSLIKIIVDEYSNSNVYINNPFNFGKIYFKTTNQLSTNNLYTRIDYDNKLYVYFPGSLLPPKPAEWWSVEEKLSSIFDVNTGQDTTITALGLAINEVWDAVGIVEGQISQLQIYTLLDTANTRIALAVNGFTLAQNILTGATAFTIAIAGYALGVALYINNNYVSTNLLNQITSNLEYTYEEKTNLTNEIIKDQYSNCLLISSNLSNLNINLGFINSNIQTQQYIKNLKCDTLDLNTGNINNINYITANEIISSGKIKQNNILLDNTYLTSNHIYNLAYNYTAERQYPPKLYNTTSTEETVSLLGKLVYRQILFLDTTSIAYASGFYEVFSSSTFDNGITTKDKLFNHNTSETTTSPRWAISLYNSGTGNYQGDNSIVSGYFGDWVIIKLPQPIMLTRYRIYQRSDFPTRAPAEWKVYGSNDGVNFTEITEASQMTRLSSYTGGFYEKTLASTFTTLYNYIGFTFNKLLSTSGQTDLSFAELQIFGKEIINNTIVSNIYTTSNAVKNIVEFDMPIVGKHYGFYISITTPININGTTFYKYDINLTPYTEKGIIQIGPQSGDTFRSFKIRVMLATMYFSYIINDLPNVCYYEVFMSYKNTAASPGVAGLNACAIGFPHNPTLQTIMPNNLFVIKNGAGSIDYITVVSTSQADVRCIIEDLLG